jgi:hypothetical protein
VGDVGKLALSAQVKPRNVEQGGAVAVHVDLSGSGNVPASILPPVREGVEWLPPETHEEMGPVGQEGWGGKRSFDFVVRMKRAGNFDLGAMTLPYWDPEAKRYGVARADLGSVVVSAPSGPAPAAGGAGADEPREVLGGLPGPRGAMEGMPAVRAHADDSPLFWLGGLAGAPLALAASAGAREVGTRARRRWRERSASPRMKLRARVVAANEACRGADARQADAAISQALEAATIAHAGINVRGVLAHELVARLEGAGVVPDAARRLADLLRECETARFAPEGSEIDAARDRWARAQGAIAQMERHA